MTQKLFSSVLCLTLLGVISPLSADESNERQIYLSEVEVQEIFSNPNRSYVYVGKDVSDIAYVITEISKLEEDQNSPIWGLRNHIERGFSIGNYDAVAQALEQAEHTLRRSSDTLDTDKARALSQSLNNIIDQVIEDKLSLDAELLSFLKDQVNISENITRSGLRLLVINEKMHVHGKTKFYKDVIFKEDVKFEDDVKFKDEVTFEDNVFIEGTLSVADEIIGCDLTVGCNINMNNSISPAIGNINKGGAQFIHNFGAGNNFFGQGAGNFTMTGIDNTGVGQNALALNTAGGSNVAVGFQALLNNTAGIQNSALGFNALASNTIGNNNVAIGFQALDSNTTGVENTAVGTIALTNNTTGNDNTAVGFHALGTNTTGNNNSAVGNRALESNTTGNNNTAMGNTALQVNSTGSDNTAVGFQALLSNTIGSQNSALGENALALNTTGVNNTAIGFQTMFANTTGALNTAVGTVALSSNTTGTNNTAVGFGALSSVTTGGGNISIGAGSGSVLTTGDNNTYIGLGATAAGESNVTRIRNIRGVVTNVADAIAVLIDSTGQLGTASSTRRVKHAIEDMGNASANIYNLRPVTFVYNSDESETRQYGLIAEETDQVFPDIVVTDGNGQPETVQYHVLPVLLLNEVQRLRASMVAAHEALARRIAQLEARA